jgi:hypothetical protein
VEDDCRLKQRGLTESRTQQNLLIVEAVRPGDRMEIELTLRARLKD